MKQDSRFGVYNLLVLHFLIKNGKQSIYSLTKKVSKIKKEKLQCNHLARCFDRLYDDGYIDYCSGPNPRSKYIKITENGRFEYKNIKHNFMLKLQFYQRIYTELLVEEQEKT